MKQLENVKISKSKRGWKREFRLCCSCIKQEIKKAIYHENYRYLQNGSKANLISINVSTSTKSDEVSLCCHLSLIFHGKNVIPFVI